MELFSCHRKGFLVGGVDDESSYMSTRAHLRKLGYVHHGVDTSTITFPH
jgi:hypothetical protein